METPPSLIELLLTRVEAYSKTTLELAKFKTLETMSTVISTLASRFIFFIVITLFIVFLSIGIALYLGDLLEKVYYGFFIVAAFYLVVGTVFYFSLDKWIKKPVGDLMISQLNTEGA
jgi:Zn-dependent protease with chaperone function